MTAATWPDLIRTDRPENRPYNHPPWHVTVCPFITGTLPENKRPTAFPVDWKPGDVPGNIVQSPQSLLTGHLTRRLGLVGDGLLLFALSEAPLPADLCSQRQTLTRTAESRGATFL